MDFVKKIEDIEESDLTLVGGKCFNLALLYKGGFPVPDGFCITMHAYRTARNSSTNPIRFEIPKNMLDEILQAYNELGGEGVAVRSSATAEDLPDASFAGQHDTLLNIQGQADLITAVKKCWASLNSERAIAYRKQKQIDNSKVSMAVIIQKMLSPDSSGVMFSVGPSSDKHLTIESAWGLGEAIVSGRITPDSFTVDRGTLQIVDRAISSKEIMFTASGRHEAPAEKRNMPSLKDEQIIRLTHLGLEIERFYSSPQDIEWALWGDKFYILQSRPITVRGFDLEMEELRQEEVRKLQDIAEDKGTVWCSFNLSETLPAPLPMTWVIISRFMSGRGGFGMTYRDLGFMPSKEVDEKGVVDLICGRTYFNLSREARLYFDEFPFEHDFDDLRSNPMKASYHKPTVNIKRTTTKFWLKFLYYVYKMVNAQLKIGRIKEDYDNKLKTEIIPKYCKYIENERKVNLSEISDIDVQLKLEEWINRILDEHAKDVLKAAVIGGIFHSSLRELLTKALDEKNASIFEELIVGLVGDITVEMNQDIWKIARDQLTMQEFIDKYGHRAVGEFELANPRWREDPTYINNMVSMFQENPGLNPEAIFLSQKERREKAEAKLQKLLSSGKARSYRKSILKKVQYTKRYLPFRENAKFHLMMGYELIRNALLELGRRHFDSADDIFYLMPDELPRLISGENFSQLIADRKNMRKKLLSIPLPDVIISDSGYQADCCENAR